MPRKSEKKKVEEFLDLALKRLERCVEAEQDNRAEAIEDLQFLNGDQWDSEEKQLREKRKRPALQINLLPKFVDHVTGDMRQNQQRVKVRPLNSKASVEIAKIRAGLIADIEHRSRAGRIYNYAGEMMVSCGYGAWRVLTRYTDENPFLQEIYLERVKNPFMVYLDPDAKDQMYADAKYGFVLEKMPKDEFKEKYPKAELPGDTLTTGRGISYELWYDEDTVTVAEYFLIDDSKKETKCLMSDGQILDKEEADAIVADYQKQVAQIQAEIDAMLEADPNAQIPPIPEGPFIEKEKEVAVPKVKHYIITACEILSKNGLEGEDFPGKYIPIVLVRGRERNIEGITYVRGLIRDAKDPQRLVNYWETAGAEFVALSPKAPWMGTAKQFEGYENDYALANVENFPFLKYNPDDYKGTLVPPPQRTHAGDPPVAIFTQTARAHDNIKSVVGMFNSDLGDNGPERTGEAIFARQRPGDLTTYHFMDNLGQAIEHSSRIINCMIPEVYDTERDIRMRFIDDTETFVPINTTVGGAMNALRDNPMRYQGIDKGTLAQHFRKAGKHATYNDIAAGDYGVVLDSGPSFATQRSESAKFIQALIQANPRLLQLAGDILVRNLDIKDADELADRIKRTIPPDIAPPKEGEPPRPPQPPPPQVQVALAKIETEKMKTKVAEMKALNEFQQAKSNMRTMMLEILQEIHAIEHPADKIPDRENEKILQPDQRFTKTMQMTQEVR